MVGDRGISCPCACTYSLPKEQNIAVNTAMLPKFCSTIVSWLSILFHVFLGGSDDLENLALGCHACNGHKYQKQKVVNATHKKSIRLFNPRRDSWEKHFKWNPTKSRIIGLTAIGRVTIAALQLNSERQIDARILWQKAGQFFLSHFKGINVGT